MFIRQKWSVLVVIGFILSCGATFSNAIEIRGGQAGGAEKLGEPAVASTFKFNTQNEEVHLTKRDGTQIVPTDVKNLYNKPDGMTIYVNGEDVISKYNLIPIDMELSDTVGWTNIQVSPGYVAIDPKLGRFKFPQPDADNDPMKQRFRSATTDYASGVCGTGGYIYVADGMGGLQIFDNTTGIKLSEYKTVYALDVSVTGKYAYVADGEAGLLIIDVSNPRQPSLIGQCDTPGNAAKVRVDNEYAYVADGQAGFIIINISDPAKPKIIGSCDTPDYASDVSVSKKYAYVADAKAGIQIISLTNMSKPVLVGSCSIKNYAAAVCLKENYLYVANSRGGLVILNITNPVNPILVGRYETADAMGVDVLGKYAYIADGGEGLKIIDISNPGTPTLVGRYNTPDYALDVYVSGEYAYIADGNTGLIAIDLPRSVKVLQGNITVDYNYYRSTEDGADVVSDVATVSVTITTNQDKYAEGEYVYATITVKNTGTKTVTLLFAASQLADFKVKDSNNHLIYLWSNGKFFSQEIKEIRLEPGQSKVLLSDSWKQIDTRDQMVSKGTYTIEAWMIEGARVNGTQVMRPKINALPKQIVIRELQNDEIGYPDDSSEWGSEPSFGFLPPSEAETKKEIGEVTIRVPKINIYEVVADGERYQRLTIADGGLTSEIGKPELPVFGSYIEIPDGVELDVVEFINEGTFTVLNGYNVYPVQEPLIDGSYEDEVNRSEGVIGTKNTTFYSTFNKFYPEKIVSVGEPTMLRGHRMTSLMLYPVQYNPVTGQLKKWSRIVIRIKYAGGIEAEIKGIDPRLEDADFESLVSSFVLNYKAPEEYENRDDEGGDVTPLAGAEYLIITHDDFYEAIQPLAEWKRKKGLKVKVVRTSEIAGVSSTISNMQMAIENASRIQEYVKTAYTTWDPAPVYLLLVGDVDKLPTHYKTTHPYHKTKTGTDLYYATMYGDKSGDYPDYSPDLFVGRLTIKTRKEAEIVVNKILNYEKNPSGGGNTDWFKRILYAAYLQNNKRGKDERFFLQTAETMLQSMKRKGYQGIRAYVPKYEADSYTYHYGEQIPSEVTNEFNNNDIANTKIINALNEGCLIALHRDHGSSRNWRDKPDDKEGWVDPRFTIDDVDRLSNGQMLPVFFSLNCMSGWFDSETDEESPNYPSLGEKLLRERDKGCIGFIAATRVSYSGYNDELCRGLFDALWQDVNPNYPSPDAKTLPMLGQILNYGKLYMYNSRVKTQEVQYPWRPNELYTLTEFEEFNLQGDPEVSVWTTVPQRFQTITYPPQVSQGSTTLEVNTGVRDALVCLMKGEEVYERKKTNKSGIVNFNISPQTEGEMSVTVTKHNYLPYEGTITITITDTNRPPFLSWINIGGYEEDGFEPNVGTAGQSFTFKIKYTDIDNNKPDTGYPRLNIFLNNQPISGGPFVMSAEDIVDTIYSDGKIYRYSMPIGIAGSYTYSFEAKDQSGLGATGSMVGQKMSGPEVKTVDGGLYDVPIKVVSPSPILSGSEFWAEIKIGEQARPVSDLFGLLAYLQVTPNGLIELATATDGAWIIPGNFMGMDVIFMGMEKDGKINIFISRKKPATGVTGTGTIVKVKFKALSPGTVSFTIGSLTAKDSNNNPISIIPVTTQVNIGTQSAVIPISPLASSPQSPGAEFLVDINVGDINRQVKDLYGLSFDLVYAPSAVIDVVPNSVIHGGLMSQQSLTPLSQVGTSSGRINICVTRIGEVPGVDGYGSVVRLRLRLSPLATGTIGLSLDNIGAYDSKGDRIRLTPATFTIQIDRGMLVWPGDTNNDGIVNEYDILPIGVYWLTNGPEREGIPFKWQGQSARVWTPIGATYADADGNGIVNAREILIIGRNWGKTHTPTQYPVAAAPLLLDMTKINHSEYLEQYRAMYKLLEEQGSDNDIPVQLKQILQGLIKQGVSQSKPEQSSLMQNYPNPFNPETWIPFNLAERTSVVIKIYDLSGQLIRVLDLGVKEPGTYLSKERAAYWDGFNDEGQEVASGVYFYQIQTKSYTSTKKMIVLK